MSLRMPRYEPIGDWRTRPAGGSRNRRAKRHAGDQQRRKGERSALQLMSDHYEFLALADGSGPVDLCFQVMAGSRFIPTRRRDRCD
jgi:hypothetical protein